MPSQSLRSDAVDVVRTVSFPLLLVATAIGLLLMPDLVGADWPGYNSAMILVDHGSRDRRVRDPRRLEPVRRRRARDVRRDRAVAVPAPAGDRHWSARVFMADGNHA
jgi:hypothetical protein